jgi:hypothetical protein
MTTINLSTTWRHRVSRGRGWARRGGIALLITGALLGFAAGIKVFLLPAHPDPADVAAIANRVDNQRDAAGQFAASFVAAVLTTPSSRLADLHRFITPADSDAATASPASTPPTPAVIDTAQVWSVVPQGPAGEVDLYAATIVVTQRAYASAPSTRAFYRVPVAIWRYQPRAMDWPAPISDPGPGADVAAGYPHPLGPTSPIYAVVSGFVSTYLTATSGLDRYVVADSWIRPIGGYHAAVVTTAATDVEVPDTAADGTRIHVRALVTAQTSQFATLIFALPLTVENSDGTWMIADIDSIPQIDGSDGAKPAGTS